ncbi:MAG: ABC transporter permease [Nocardioidaceae bacterium]|nr:ABC transporter permease [Nocardioidaceae bacterium]
MALLSRQAPRLASRLTDYWVTVYKRTWRGSVVTSFLMPFLYLTALGVGLGGFVDDAGPEQLGGITYLAFIAPGLLATTAMQIAVGESMYPVMACFKWDKTYYSMAATPLRVPDIVAAHLTAVAFRVFTTSAVFLGVLAVFGALHSWWGGLVALAVAVLLGLAHAAPVFGVTARLDSPSGFALIFRLGLIPMFLFSGAFFPVSQLGGVAWLAYVTPIWHGVELCRMLTLGAVEWWPVLGHLSYLAVWLAAGWVFALTGFAKRLAQ